MRNALNLIVLFFFFIIISCKENQSFNREPNTSKKSTLDSLNFSKEAEFKQIILKCSGEEYNAKECISEKEEFSISFSQNSINFSINNRDFIDNNVSDLGELGYQPYLFENINNKLIILDSYLENGHLLYFYFYDKAGLKFLGKKEIIINEEINLFEKIKLSQIKNELVITVGNGIEDLRFDVDKGINLNASSNISVNEIMEKSKTNNNWKGSYKITTKIISQFDNKQADVLYTMTIESNQKAILSIGAENVQDYWCEGEYRLIKEDNILHAKGKCDQDDMDDFYLKNENGKYYIKSKRFINQNWQELLTTD